MVIKFTFRFLKIYFKFNIYFKRLVKLLVIFAIYFFEYNPFLLSLSCL